MLAGQFLGQLPLEVLHADQALLPRIAAPPELNHAANDARRPPPGRGPERSGTAASMCNLSRLSIRPANDRLRVDGWESAFDLQVTVHAQQTLILLQNKAFVVGKRRSPTMQEYQPARAPLMIKREPSSVNPGKPATIEGRRIATLG